jgi:hypothetical protein
MFGGFPCVPVAFAMLFAVWSYHRHAELRLPCHHLKRQSLPLAPAPTSFDLRFLRVAQHMPFSMLSATGSLDSSEFSSTKINH